jgi:tetratricopeptide (TPR) repeat protein
MPNRTMMDEQEVARSADPIVHYQFGHERQAAGDFSKAIRHFKLAISLDPNRLDAEVYAFTAWLLAMCPDTLLRDGPKAVEYATVACDLTDWHEGWTIGILAAALAETGELARAIERQVQACEHAFDIDREVLKQNLAVLKSGGRIPFGCYP